MNACELTEVTAAAKSPALNNGGEKPMQLGGWRFGKRWSCSKKYAALAVASASALGLGGCIQVTAPEKPIVIELNINIRQEVVYRLAADAAKTVEENGGIF